MIQRSSLIQYIRNNHYDKVDSAAERLVIRSIENGLKRVNRERYWSFQKDSVQIATKAPYAATGTASVTVGTTSVAFIGIGVVMPSDVVGAFIQIGSDTQWYEITVRGGDTAITIRQPYHGPAAAAHSYIIAYPAYDLPANFRRQDALIDVRRRQPMRYIQWTGLQWQMADYTGASASMDYTIAAKRNDGGDAYQLWLYPPPDAKEVYTLLYYKDSGWFDTNVPATSTWKREATVDTDYADWPVRHMDLLRQACLVSLYQEVEQQKYGFAMESYMRLLNDAMNDDEQSGQIKTLSSGTGRRATRWTLE